MEERLQNGQMNSNFRLQILQKSLCSVVGIKIWLKVMQLVIVESNVQVWCSTRACMIGLQFILKIKRPVKFFLKQFSSQKVVLNTRLLSKEWPNKINSYYTKLKRLSNKSNRCSSNRIKTNIIKNIFKPLSKLIKKYLFSRQIIKPRNIITQFL